MIDQYKVGDKVVISYDFDSRLWKDKEGEPVLKNGLRQYFVDQRVWKIEAQAVEQPASGNAEPTPTPTPSKPAGENFPGENQGIENLPGAGDTVDPPDDLPF